MATQRKATSKSSTKDGTAKKASSRGTGGRVVEEISKTMVAVYPAAKTGDYEALAKELIEQLNAQARWRHGACLSGLLFPPKLLKQLAWPKSPLTATIKGKRPFIQKGDSYNG